MAQADLDGNISLDDVTAHQKYAEEIPWTGAGGETHDPLGRRGCSRIRPAIDDEDDDRDSDDFLNRHF